MRTLVAPLLLRAAASAGQPAAGGAAFVADAAISGSLLFASGRLTWWHSFSSQHELPSPSDTAPTAAALPGVSVQHRLQGASTGQQPGGTAAAAGAAVVTDKAHHAVQPSSQHGQSSKSGATAGPAPVATAAAAAGAAPASAGLQAGRRRVNWRLNHGIEWTPELAADAHHFWREQGVTRASQLKRLARWTELSPLFRDLPQLAQRMARWREAAARLGRPEADALRLVLSERSIIDKGADPHRVISNMLAIERAYAAHGLNAHGVLRSRVLRNKTDTIVAQIPKFLESVESWPVKVDYGAMLERNPGLLGSHSNNFSVYTERVTALAQWAPPSLDLNKFLVRAPTMLNLLPALVQQRYSALQELLQLDEERMVEFITFAPGLLSRRPGTNSWKIAYHRAYAEHRAREGLGDELRGLHSPEQFPSRLCNLLLQSAERVQRLRYLLEQHGGEAEVLARTGYSWVRQAPAAWRTAFPGFLEWLRTQPRDPAGAGRAGTREAVEAASSSYSSDDDSDREP